MRTATVRIDAGAVSPARALMALARAAPGDNGPLVAVTGRAWRDLADELGDDEAAIRHLLRVATTTGRPLCVNFSIERGSRTVFVVPRDWSEERLRGWVAGRHEELEHIFGRATPVRLEDV